MTSPQRQPDDAATAQQQVRIRRSPRYVNFMLIGALIGAIAAFVLTLAFPENPDYSRMQVFGFLVLACVAIGIALLGLLAIILDRVVSRRSTIAVADRVDVHEGALPAAELDATEGEPLPLESPQATPTANEGTREH